MGLKGTVSNTAAGVRIVVQGPNARRFAVELKAHPPQLARISSFTVRRTTPRNHSSFRIVRSATSTETGVDVLPDIATCPDCRRELADPNDRRSGYAFTNCTQCGPRYTIIETLPYDRPRTTMRRFVMCPDCQSEYEDPGDRRFHAQPNACPRCGPQLTVLSRTRERCPGTPMEVAAKTLLRGRILAIKSLGGYQLACRADVDSAVRRLRRRKTRPAKPLALMCDRIADIREFCRVGTAAAALLRSPAAPIVLLPKRQAPKRTLSDRIAPANRDLGVMLAYTPLHVALFNRLRRELKDPPVLVMTSANLKDDPITATESELYDSLGNVFDSVLTHDRPIANRCDDSVVAAKETPIVVRRARGFSPQPIVLDSTFHVKHPCLAVGAELKGCFTLAAGSKAYVGPHIGSLSSPAAERFFVESLGRYLDWTGLRPRTVACDLHPDYLSTRWAERFAQEHGARIVRVQHHHAHVVSVLAEHGIRQRVLGLSFDGTGLGTDGAIWGCEFLEVDTDLSWTRRAHLGYLKLSEFGGSAPDPQRMAASYLLQCTRGIGGHSRLRQAATAVRHRLESGNYLATSSLGRLFDAVAGMTGICQQATFEGEPAVALEGAAASGETRSYYGSETLCFGREPATINAAAIVRRVAADLAAKTAPEQVAARFQNTVVRASVAMADAVAAGAGIKTVVLSGGAFQNDRLRTGISRMLTRAGYRVLHNRLVPLNDGGISLGQALAANRTH